MTAKQPSSTNPPSTDGTPRPEAYKVHVLNVSTGTEEDVLVPASAWRRAISLWPTYTVYVIGFALLGASFIANTLRLYVIFVVLLALAAGLVLGTATVRYMRYRRNK